MTASVVAQSTASITTTTALNKRDTHLTPTRSFAPLSSAQLTNLENLPSWFIDLCEALMGYIPKELNIAGQMLDGPGTVGLNFSSLDRLGFELSGNLGDLGLPDVLELDNITLTLIGTAAVNVSNPAASEGEIGLLMQGTVSVFGLQEANIAIQFYINQDKEKTAIATLAGPSTFNSPISDILDTVLSAVSSDFSSAISALTDLSISQPAIAFASESIEASEWEEQPFSMGISQGLNLYGSLDMSTVASKSDSPVSLGKLLKFVAGFLGVDQLSIHAAINKTMAGTQLILDAVIEQDLTVIGGKDFKLIYKGCTIGLMVSGNPAEPSLSLSNTASLTLDWIGADNLELTGTIKTEAESVTAAYTLQQGPDGGDVWHPFGFSGFSVGALAMQFGGTYVAPWIDNVGIASRDVTIGDVAAEELAILIDTNDPDQFVLVVKIDEITLLQLLSVFTPVTFAAYQLLSDATKRMLNNVVDVSLSGVDLSIVPSATQIGELVYDDEGLTVRGRLNAWGWNASVDIELDDTEVDARGEMDPLSLTIEGVEVFSLSGAEGDKKPIMQFSLSEEELPEFYVSTKLSLLGVRKETYMSGDENGLTFVLEDSSSTMTTRLSGSFGYDRVQTAGSIDMNLDMSVSLPMLGTVRLVEILCDTSVELDAALVPNIVFQLDLAGQFEFWGDTLTVPALTLRTPPVSWGKLYELLQQHIIDNAEDIFDGVFSTLADWADAVADGTIEFAGSVADVAQDAYGLGEDAVTEVIAAYKTLGEGVEDVAAGLRNTYDMGEAALTSALKQADYAINDVSRALKNVYRTTDAAAAQALKQAGYAANQVGSALKSVYRISDTTASNVLKGAGYTANEVGTVLKSVYRLSDSAMARALKGAGYGVNDVGMALKAVYGVGSGVIAQLLKELDYGAKEVGTLLQSAYRLSGDAAAQALETVGYGASEVGAMLKDTYRFSSSAATRALKGASYSASQVGNVLNASYGLGDSATASILKGAGYSANQVGQAMKDVYRLGDEATAKVLKSVSYSAKEVGDVMKSVYGLGDKSAAKMLKKAGYSAKDVGKALKSVYGTSKKNVEKALKSAGYSSSKVWKAILNVF
ncbi:MAG: hypothetical protein AAGD25_19945 [Cyanobacteria bacterium P01_F01_bin.150]